MHPQWGTEEAPCLPGFSLFLPHIWARVLSVPLGGFFVSAQRDGRGCPGCKELATAVLWSARSVRRCRSFSRAGCRGGIRLTGCLALLPLSRRTWPLGFFVPVTFLFPRGRLNRAGFTACDSVKFDVAETVSVGTSKSRSRDLVEERT